MHKNNNTNRKKYGGKHLNLTYKYFDEDYKFKQTEHRQTCLQKSNLFTGKIINKLHCQSGIKMANF